MPLVDAAGGADRDGSPVQGGAPSPTTDEELVTRRGGHEAHLQPSVGDEGDGDAPGGHAVDEGLRAVDRVDDPDAIAASDVVSAGLLSEEAIPGEGERQAIPE